MRDHGRPGDQDHEGREETARVVPRCAEGSDARSLRRPLGRGSTQETGSVRHHDPRADFRIEPEESTAQIVDLYRAECKASSSTCLLYTSDAADDLTRV